MNYSMNKTRKWLITAIVAFALLFLVNVNVTTATTVEARETNYTLELTDESFEGVILASSDDIPEGEETNFTVDKDEKAGGTAAIIIIIIVAVIFIAGAVIWYVRNNKQDK